MRSTTPNRAGLLLAAALVLSAPVFAQTIVAGSSNPFLAGMPNGSTCCSGDSAPAQSPVLAPGSLTPGTSLTFAVTGSVDHTGGTPTLSPDGSGIFSTPSNNGISGANWPIDALVGVFLDASQPDSSAAPSGLDFTNTSFTTLSPQLKQAFFIGDGLTGTGSGSPQTFVVPAGATRLFLGTSDGFGAGRSADPDARARAGGRRPDAVVPGDRAARNRPGRRLAPADPADVAVSVASYAGVRSA